MRVLWEVRLKHNIVGTTQKRRIYKRCKQVLCVQQHSATTQSNPRTYMTFTVTYRTAEPVDLSDRNWTLELV